MLDWTCDIVNRHLLYPAASRLLAFTKSFVSLVNRIVGFFTPDPTLRAMQARKLYLACRLQVVPHLTRARVKITSREKRRHAGVSPFLALGDLIFYYP